MQTTKHSQGFTLVELMITVAIIGVLTAIAVPAYKGYITTSAKTTCDANAHSLAGFEDTYFYDHDTYVAGTYDPGGDVTTLPNALSWKPEGDNDKYTYVVTKNTGTIADGYIVTVTYKPNHAITAVVSRQNP